MSRLVSIIVPVYNVEKYLRKCVESLINQSYKNIEIILVDDGSMDGSGKICDDYRGHKRVTVIHKKNGGLSDARNAGIKIARGELIVFVDSDDWVERNFVEDLVKIAAEEKADIVICGFLEEDSGGNVIGGRHDSRETIKTFGPHEAIEDLLLEKTITNHAWNKLYPTSFFKEIRYPKGSLMEDIGTTYRLLMKAKRIAVTNKPLYHYLQRSTSILGKNSIKLLEDHEKMVVSRAKNISAAYPSLKDGLDLEYTKLVFDLHRLAAIGGFSQLYNGTHYREMYKNARTIYRRRQYDNSRNVRLFYACRLFYIFLVRVKRLVKGKGAK